MDVTFGNGLASPAGVPLAATCAHAVRVGPVPRSAATFSRQKPAIDEIRAKPALSATESVTWAPLRLTQAILRMQQSSIFAGGMSYADNV